MKRRHILFVFCFLLFITQWPILSEEMPRMRALLIAGDTFITQPSLAPSAQTNTETMRALLSGDKRAYASITSSVNVIADEQTFRDQVSLAFKDARDKDISLVYLSTHGLPAGPGGEPFYFLLSDGKTEYVLTLPILHQALAAVPGVKVLVVDTCNSGMVIGKGTSWNDDFALFRQEGFVVLTASGGNELSFNWTSGTSGAAGGSYFMLALDNGLSPRGKFVADANRDGQVTITELRSYLLTHYGPSTAQVYSEDDAFVLYKCASSGIGPSRFVVTDVVFEDTFLSSKDREVTFSYTLNRRARLGYQLIYEQDGFWQFRNSQILDDTEDSTGVASAGRKERTLLLKEFDEKAYGYVLLLIVQVEEDKTIPLSSTLLSVEDETPEAISVMTPPHILRGQELAVQFTHGKPCTYTVRIKDPRGSVVATPYLDHTSRPQMLKPAGTIVYWNGKDDRGEPVTPGVYFAQVETTVSGQTEVSVSAAFTVV